MPANASLRARSLSPSHPGFLFSRVSSSQLFPPSGPIDLRGLAIPRTGVLYLLARHHYSNALIFAPHATKLFRHRRCRGFIKLNIRPANPAETSPSASGALFSFQQRNRLIGKSLAQGFITPTVIMQPTADALLALFIVHVVGINPGTVRRFIS